MCQLKTPLTLSSRPIIDRAPCVAAASGEDAGAVPAAPHAARVPARRPRVDGDDVQPAPQRDPRRRDGARQDDPDDRRPRAPRVRARRVGAAPDRRADERDAQLGDGAEEVVSGVQDPHLLRHAEGAQAEANGERVSGGDGR